MKFKFTLLLTLLVAFSVASCDQKDLYDENRVDKGVTDLVVPAGFDWNMIDPVSCNFTTSVATYVEVYTDKSCNDNSLVAEYVLEPDMEALQLSVATAVSSLYIKVGDAEAVPVAIVNGAAVYTVPATKANSSIPGEYYDDGTYGWVYFPHKGNGESENCPWATVMFEDYFPLEGDYDFNDVVANYRYAVKLSKQQGNGEESPKFHVISIDVTAKVRALGGTFKYAPYLRVIGMQLGNKDGFTTSTGGVTLFLNSNGKDPVVRIDKYATKPADAKYLNTDPAENPVPESKLEVVKFTLGANNDKGTGVKQEDIKFDFYLEGTGYESKTYEIHHKGFAPVKSSNYPSGSSWNLGKEYYTTSNGFVWGITVPVAIDHAKEQTNFLKAYPYFEKWVESGGATDTDWYDKPDRAYTFIIPNN